MKKVYRIRFGSSVRIYHTWYHADQFMRALDLNGTLWTLVIEEVKP